MINLIKTQYFVFYKILKQINNIKLCENKTKSNTGTTVHISKYSNATYILFI